MRFSEKQNIALVLSGGGVKAAAFHIGVCMALREKGFLFAGGSLDSSSVPNDSALAIRQYVGSSAGSIIAAFLASGYSIESMIEAFEMGHKISPFMKRGIRKTYDKLKPISYLDIFSVNPSTFTRMIPKFGSKQKIVAGGIETLLKHGFKINGLFTTKGIEKYLRKHVLPSNNFKDLSADLFVVTTQLNHSRKVVFGPFDETSKGSDVKWANYAKISEAVAASASLPPVFAPYAIKNERGENFYFFDGEIRDTLSTHVATDNGADLVIASYSIQPYHYNSIMGSLHDYGIPIIINQALYQVIEQKIQSSISRKEDIKQILSAIDGYIKQTDIDEHHRHKLLEIIKQRVEYKDNVDYIYIHPHPQDYEMFFVDHFSLNADILARIVRIGFKSAIRTLRKHNL